MKPHKSSFQGALSFNTRFLKRLITFASALNNTTNDLTNQYKAVLKQRARRLREEASFRKARLALDPSFR